jgi:cytochrome c oxidase assembly protein subunit 15
MNQGHDIPDCPRWLHGLAVLTVLFTLPLIFLGASVTSFDVGMVDARGFRMPWEIIVGLFENVGLAFVLEYGHRTFGFIVGLCGIGLAIGCWFCDRRPGMRWIGFVALAMIIAQGLLGIFRVDYNALHGRTFAMVHGVFAQLVLAVLVSVALLTAKRSDWDNIIPGKAVQRWSMVALLVVFVQLILGGLVRHKEDWLGPRGHLFGAFVVTGIIVYLLVLMHRDPSRTRFRTQRIMLKTLLVVQLLLGIESWLAKFYVAGSNLPQLAPIPVHAEWIRTAHYLVGALLFSTTVGIALLAYRQPVLSVKAAPEFAGVNDGPGIGDLEGAR